MAAGAVLSVALIAIGGWNTVEIKNSALRSAAVSSAVFMRLVLEPSVQELAYSDTLSQETQDRLDAILLQDPLDDRLVSIKIWRTDGTVVYSTHPALIGQRFALADVQGAVAGEVVVSYDELKADNEFERAMSIHLLEITSPLYQLGTDRVIAVGEYYENADLFDRELNLSLLRTWLVVAATMLVTLGVLFLIVRRGNSTIAGQRAELNSRISQAEAMAQQNEELRIAADRARLDASEANEQLLASIGAELHDGPIQLLSVVRLQFSVLRRALRIKGLSDDPVLQTEEIEKIASDALADLRNLSVGLILPEIEDISLPKTIELAVERHTEATGAQIHAEIDMPDLQVTRSLKICAYRVVQEGLTNAHKHATGAPVRVTATVSDGFATLVVADVGPGTAATKAVGGRQKLGIAGLRNRVAAAKGTLDIRSGSAGGTELIVVLPLAL